jgi:chlorite dismutase
MNASMPGAPLTLEGAAVLHQMMRVKWSALRSLPSAEIASIAEEACSAFGNQKCSAPFAVLGHKADLMLMHLRRDFEELAQVQMTVSRLRLSQYLEPANSYLSVIELGLYESTVKTYQSLAERGIEPHSEAWNEAVEEVLKRQRDAMSARLFPSIPDTRYICFYPMDRKRGEDKNWYSQPMAERQRMMHEHGLVGRRYAGQVKQIISGSMGLDDWEWGVTLFSADPVVFKKLIYEMRFDEVSAVYALFGTFYVGVRFAASDFAEFLNGQIPAFASSGPDARGV